jgi:hypothetical protein
MTAVSDPRRRCLLGAFGESTDAARSRARDADRAELSMRRSSGTTRDVRCPCALGFACAWAALTCRAGARK